MENTGSCGTDSQFATVSTLEGKNPCATTLIALLIPYSTPPTLPPPSLPPFHPTAGTDDRGRWQWSDPETSSPLPVGRPSRGWALDWKGQEKDDSEGSRKTLRGGSNGRAGAETERQAGPGTFQRACERAHGNVLQDATLDLLDA